MNQLKSVPIGGTGGKTHKWSWQIEEEKRQKEEEEEMEKWCVICNNNGHVRLVIYQNNLLLTSRYFSNPTVVFQILKKSGLEIDLYLEENSSIQRNLIPKFALAFLLRTNKQINSIIHF